MTFDKKRLALFVLLVFALFSAGYRDAFRVMSKPVFAEFQHDSESLVIGKIIADDYGTGLEHANLTATWLDNQALGLRQSYALVDAKILPDLKVQLLKDYDNEHWNSGISKDFAGVMVSDNDSLGSYIGREIVLDNQRRIVTDVSRQDGAGTILHVSGPPIKRIVETSGDIKISGEKASASDIRMKPYSPQFGIQGLAFSKLKQVAGLRLPDLYKINALLFAVVAVTLAFLYSGIFSKTFAAIFFVTLVASPMITGFARNLYWIPFSWFLPAVFSSLYLLGSTRLKKYVFLGLLYFAFLLKFLAGYEYTSSVILFAAAPFLYSAIVQYRKRGWIVPLRQFVIICAIGAAAFATALLIHAEMRSGSLASGLLSIWEEDAKRRTYGDPAAFHPAYAESLRAPFWAVVKMYIFKWHAAFLALLPGVLFPVLFFLSLATIVCRRLFINKRLDDLALFTAFLLPPLSWYVLGKAHSFIHTHINFVLWYLGFAAALLQVSFNGLKIAVFSIHAWVKKVKADEL